MVNATLFGSAEFYEAAAVLEHLLRIKTVLEFFGFETRTEIKLDSPAAKSVAIREEVGVKEECALWKHVYRGFITQFEGNCSNSKLWHWTATWRIFG